MPVGETPTSLLPYPTWKKYRCVHATVARMSIREKRRIFALLRNHPWCSHHTLVPAYGVTLGDFCAMHILMEQTRKS